jgi:hypothetical protein
MDRTNPDLQKIFTSLNLLSTVDKIRFFEILLFTFTIAGRGIWSDNLKTDTEKVVAFKWMNELLHRIWNINFELKQGQDTDSITRLFENMKFYGEQSDLLKEQILATISTAVKRYNLNGRTGSA